MISIFWRQQVKDSRKKSPEHGRVGGMNTSYAK